METSWMDRIINQGSSTEEFVEALSSFGFNVDFRYRYGRLEMKVRKMEVRTVNQSSKFRIVHTHRRQRL